MKIDFFIHERFQEPEVRICNKELNDEVKQLKNFIDQAVNIAVMGYDQGEVRLLRASEIYRLYSENQKTIAETQNHSYQVHATLTEMEQQMPKGQFVRISRSELVNVKQIKKIDTSIARTIQMSLKNGTQTFVSRRNVAQIKKLLGI